MFKVFNRDEAIKSTRDGNMLIDALDEERRYADAGIVRAILNHLQDASDVIHDMAPPSPPVVVVPEKKPRKPRAPKSKPCTCDGPVDGVHEAQCEYVPPAAVVV